MDDTNTELAPKGFVNTSSICYFNALLQCFLVLKSTQTIFSSSKYKYTPYLSTSLLLDINLLLDKKGLDTQESSSEYLHFLIDFLDKESKSTYLYDSFTYSYKHINKCLHCGYIIKKIDKTTCLLLESNMNEIFNIEEIIDDYACENCKQRCQLQLTKQLYEFNDVIVVSLNKYFTKKKFDYLHYFIINNIRYELVATIEHYGNLDGGHYVSRVKKNNKIYFIDDLQVKEIPDFYNDDQTYLLFYERV